jgi:hypothetical protein
MPCAIVDTARPRGRRANPMARAVCLLGDSNAAATPHFSLFLPRQGTRILDDLLRFILILAPSIVGFMRGIAQDD